MSLIRSLVEVQHYWFSTFQENERAVAERIFLTAGSLRKVRREQELNSGPLVPEPTKLTT